MAEVVSITRPYESPYVCDRCGADRACQCKSKGVSRKTWENEASKAKKAVKNQGDSPARENPVENTKESSPKAYEWTDPEDCKHDEDQRTEFGWGHCPICMEAEIKRLKG